MKIKYMTIRKNVFIFFEMFLLLLGALAYCLSAPPTQAAEAIPQDNWTLKYVDSEELIGENGAAINAFDGDANTIWHTKWHNGSDPQPHEIQIDLGDSYNVTGFRYLPRQDGVNHGRIKDYEFYTSADGNNWNLVLTGTFINNAFEQEALFAQEEKGVKYIKLKTLSAHNNNPWTSMAEINLLSASAQVNSGGLWGQYTKKGWCKYRYEEFKSLSIENINFKSFSFNPLEFHNSFDGILLSRAGRIPFIDCALVKWKGAIYADKTGDYDFRVDMNGHQQYSFLIDNESLFSGSSDKSGVRNLTAGWHSIYIETYVYANSLNSKFQVYWTPPGESEEIIPADNLNHKFWANNKIIIPETGKAKINYVAAGVGTTKAIEEGTDPVIEIDMPVADLGDILKDEVWITWFSRNKLINKDITITNNNTTISRSITGTELKTEQGLKLSYPGMKAKIPAVLIDDNGTGKLSFSFSGLGESGAEENGIGIIVPYKDLNMPKGQIVLKMYSASAHRGIAPAFVFPLGEDMDKGNIQPLFFLDDGETKSSAWFRPNYLMMLSGSGSMPDETAVLKDMPGAKMIVPESNPHDRSNDNTWYPNYGREGRQFDVISPNYKPNQWSGKDTIYVGNDDGKINPISIPPTHTWIAFQYYGTGFAEDGITYHRSGESGSISGGGLFSTLNDSEDNHTLTVTVVGNGNVSSDLAGINCPGDCSGLYDSSTSIVLTATANAGSEFSGWSGGNCSGTGNCTITMDEDKTVTATFITPVVNGTCGSAIDTPSCSAPSENLCATGNVSVGGVSEASNKWKWVCEGSGGGANASCETEKRCYNWTEVAP